MGLENGAVCGPSGRSRGTIIGIWGPSVIVKVVYSDESAKSGEKTEPIMVVAAYIIDLDEQWDSVEAAIEKAIKQPARRALLKDGREIKGSILFNKIEHNRTGATETRKMLTELLSIVAEHFMPVFHGAVNIEGFKKRGPEFAEIESAQQYALMTCLGRVEHFVHKEKVIWIADKDVHEEKRMLKGTRMHRYLQQVDLNAAIPDSKVKFKAPHLPHIVDAIYFGESVESRALQLADVCAATISRVVNQRPLGQEFFKIIQIHLASAAWGVNFDNTHDASKALLGITE